MNSALVALFLTLFIPVFMILWNRQRTRGKILCFFARKDKSLIGNLCRLRSSFIIWEDRAYDLYPDFIRITRFPLGWPSILQELVPTCLYDEEDALPRDWITLEKPEEGSLTLRAALEENWVKKLVQEAAAEGGLRINWRRVIPIALMAIGIVGLIMILMMKGCAVPGA